MSELTIIKAQIKQIETKLAVNGVDYQVLYLNNGRKVLNFCDYNVAFELGKDYYLACQDNKLISFS